MNSKRYGLVIQESEAVNLKLYSHWMSSCSFRVRFALNLKGLKYHYVAITTSSKSDPEFLKLNPLALIPILVDGDFVLAESLAIIMVAHIFLQNNIIEKKVGPYEKLPWAQSVIRKGFTALEKLLKDHTGRYATRDKIFLVLAIHMTMLMQDHLEDFNWCCRGICNPTTHSRGKQHCISQNLEVKRSASIFAAVPLGMNKGMNTDTIVKAKSFLDGDEDQHEKDVFEKNLKVLQNIF
ncbi:hypothetical protein Ahy_B01g053784 [Arachis hypogaea]|uniref:GST N-terminal domain-containing protein n=1 Tax=Arachis hypogaea TaxID=3818 RepID=A0A445ASL9_ARAHY|nr:hypothetical protein Ahy_B01g053784 [Arachis hypogaea]